MVVVNYWAVAAAAVAMVVVGAAWYGPLFSKLLAELQGVRGPARIAPADGSLQNYAVFAVGAFLLAYVLRLSIGYAEMALGTDGANAGLMVAIFLWLGFVAPILAGSVLWEGKSWSLWFFNAAYFLFAIVIASLVLSLWT